MSGIKRQKWVVLKRCPWCGEEPEVFESYSGFYRVVCENDKCKMTEIYVSSENKKEAIAIWNRRKP